MNRTICAVGRGAIALGASAALVSCTNPVSTSSHVQPTGVEILYNGERIVLEGGGTVTGNLVLVRGETLGPVTVRFLDGATPLEPGGAYFLSVVVADETVIRFDATAPGAYTGSFEGLAVGQTTLRLRLMHGLVGSPRAHHDYQSAPIAAQVVGPSPPGAAGAATWR
jgi:hypothetical protein